MVVNFFVKSNLPRNGEHELADRIVTMSWRKHTHSQLHLRNQTVVIKMMCSDQRQQGLEPMLAIQRYTRTHPRKTTDLKKQGGLNTCEAAHLQSCGIIDRLFWTCLHIVGCGGIWNLYRRSVWDCKIKAFGRHKWFGRGFCHKYIQGWSARLTKAPARIHPTCCP